MKKLLIILFLLPFLGQAQTTYQLNYDSIRVNKTAGTGGTSLYGKVYLKNVSAGLSTDSALVVRNGRIFKFSAIPTLSFGTFGSTPNAQGGSFAAGVITLQPASASFSGGVTTGTQTFAGAKTFNNGLSASNSIGNTIASTCSATGGIAFYGQSSAGIGAQFDSGASGEAALIAKHTNSGPLQYWMNTSAVVATMSNAGNLTANSFVKSGGTSSQFLMADGSVNTSVLPTGAYLPLLGGTLTGGLIGTTASFTGNTNLASSSGVVGIGTASPVSGFKLEVQDAIPAIFTATSDATSSSYGGVSFKRNTKLNGNGNGFGFSALNSSDANAEYGYFGIIIESNTASSENGTFVWMPGFAGVRTERMRLSSSGLLTLSGALSGTSATFSGTLGINGTANNVTSGTYTPTLTNVTNVSGALVLGTAKYQRIGNIVTVFGALSYTTGGSAGASEIGITLPIASNFTSIRDAIGNTSGEYDADIRAAYIGSDATNDRAALSFVTVATNLLSLSFYSFSYEIL